MNLTIDEKIKLKNEYLSEKNISHMLLKDIYSFNYTLKKSKKHSDRTRHILINNIELFGRYLYLHHSHIALKNVNEDIIKEYRDFCKNILDNSPKTVNKKLSSLCTFWDYLIDAKKFKYNIVKNISYLNLEKEKAPTIISTSDLLKLFDTMRNYLYGCRDVCVCKLILETGLSVKKVLDLKLGDLSISEHSLFITNPDNSVNRYTLGSNLINELNNYLSIRTELDLNNCDYLFLSKRGTQYSIRSFELFFKEANNYLKLNYMPRNLRSTFLYNLSTIINPSRLQEIAQQTKVKHYYELNDNPLRNLI